MNVYCVSAAIALLASLSVSIVHAHLDPGTKLRHIVLTESDTTTEVYIRTPVPLLFGDILKGAPDPEGFLINHGTDIAPRFFLSAANIEKSRTAFAQRLTNSLQWSIGLHPVSSRVRAYRVLPAEPELRLQSSSIGRASMSEPSTTHDVAISTGYIDMLVSVAAVASTQPLKVKSGIASMELSDGVQIDNHVIDERSEPRRNYSRQGQLQRAITLPHSLAGWTVEYIVQGVVHILEGIDHVLLVVAMALGSASTMALIRSITAFTLGHAVTLIAGFLGFVPQALWFVPAIESAIAATIIIAAATSMLLKNASTLLYGLIGLLHGFGFSFVLGNILGKDSPDLLPALAAFTVGIEVGQLAIVAGVLAALLLVRKSVPTIEKTLRYTVLIGISAAACLMIIERIPMVISAYLNL